MEEETEGDGEGDGVADCKVGGFEDECWNGAGGCSCAEVKCILRMG